MDVPAGAPLRVGSWCLDPQRDCISRAGQRVQLEPRLMRLLRLFTRHAGETLSIERILEDVWGDVVVTPDSVYQAVGALRRALGEGEDGGEYIATVPRRGYRLVAPVVPVAPEMPAYSPAPVAAMAASRSAQRPHVGAVVATLALAALVALGATVPRALRQSADPPARTPAASAAGGAEAARPAAVAPPSLAVLPFQDLSSARDQQYLADGMAEELMASLAAMPHLRVIARTSSVAAARDGADAREVARRLGVTHVIEGSVRRDGGSVRVTTKLVRGVDGVTVWSQTYQRELGNLFAIQDDIGTAVGRSLALVIAGGEVGPRAGRTEVPEAHTQLLLARELMRRGGPEAWRRALEALDRAVAQDPGYAAAVAARVRVESNFYDWTSEPRWLERATADADRAIALAPQLADGFAARADLEQWYQFDWSGAQADLERAHALEPFDVEVLSGETRLLASLGRLDDALAMQRKAVALDPISVTTWRDLGFILTELGDYGAADEALQHCLQIDPDDAYAHSDLGKLRLLQGKFAAARAAFERVTFEPLRLRGLASAEYSLGHRRLADRYLREMIHRYDRKDAYQIAEVYAWRGERGAAFGWFERAVRQRDAGLGYLKFDVLIASVHDDPRYRTLLARMGLPP